MKKPGTRKIVIIASALLLVLGVIACGRMGHLRFMRASHEEKARMIVERVSSELQLREDQKQFLTTLKDDIISRVKQHAPQRRQIADQVLDMIKSERLDQDKLNRLFEQAHARRTEMRRFLIGKAAEFHAILTPQQREQLASKLDGLHRKWYKRHNK